MNLLAVIPLYPPHSRVGSWLSSHECLKHLAARGHEVTVVTSCTSAWPPYELDGVDVVGRNARTAEMYARADVILSHLGDDQRAARLAMRQRKPLVRMVHGVVGGDRAKLIQYGVPALTVWNSNATAAAIGDDGPSVVVHPPVDPDTYRVEPIGTHITLVNLSEEKGGELFWNLAHLLPHLSFLGVHGGYGRQIIQDRPNVTIIEPTDDMAADVYAKTKILLVPSEAESWGRVGVEAMISGIPVIAHPTPGLRESLGKGATFVDRQDLNDWYAAILELRQPSKWRAASKRALARAAQLGPEADLERFSTAVEALCN